MAAGAAGQAHAETRTLKLYFIHTKERAEITFKRNGRYDAGGLKKINQFLRDWRRNEPTKMDPRLLDLVWEAYKATGARDYIHVVSAYRSPATNSMLRSRSKGVAKKSQHTLGKAMDFYIPGVRLSNLRAAGLRMGGGGVGYYPGSGSPFVHFDVGSVRHWPRMSRKELVAVFPRGGTLHVPTDGKPLPGYQQALASYKSRGRSSTVLVASNSDDDSESATRGKSSGGSGKGFLATLFGGGADEDEDNSEVQVAVGREPVVRGTGRSPAKSDGGSLPGVAVAAAPEPAAPIADIEETPERIIAALPARSIPLPAFAPRPEADVGPLVALAAVEGSDTDAVAKAAEMALGIPLPPKRPEAEIPAAEPVAVADAAAQIRNSALADVIRASDAGLPDAVVAAKSSDDVILAAYAPVPGNRPDSGPLSEMIAALPKPRPTAGQDIVGSVQPKSAKTARVGGVDFDTQRAAILASLGKADAARALRAEVRTTGKTAKPGPQDLKSDRRPVTIPVEKVAARWALETAGRLTRSMATAETPSLAYNEIRTAPKQVYTAGFTPVLSEPDPARFYGNAVTFLSVASFETN